MEITSFHTIKAASQGIYKDKGSKFIALAFPVSSEEEVKNFLAKVKKDYFDARHHCYAYTLGADKSKYRAFDDGEPNHSAGDPILGQIRSKDLTNVLVIVVRYFGGTKLGVSGLIQAYRTAAREALENTEIIEREIVERFKIEFEYPSTSEIMKLVNDCDAEIISQNFAESCFVELDVKIRLSSYVIEKIERMKNLGHRIEVK